MRVVVATALAVALAAVSLAAQSPVESSKAHKGRTVDSASPQMASGQATGKRLWRPLLVSERRAVSVAQPLCDGSSKDPAMVARALGSALLEVENQMSSLEKGATGNQKTELASFRSHESQARMHYGELMKGLSNQSAVRQHAVAIRQELNAAGGALTTFTDSWSARQ